MAVNDRRYGLTVIYFIGGKITGKSVALLLTGNVNLIILISKTVVNNICHKKLCSCIFQNVAFCSQKHPTEKSGVLLLFPCQIKAALVSLYTGVVGLFFNPREKIIAVLAKL